MGFIDPSEIDGVSDGGLPSQAEHAGGRFIDLSELDPEPSTVAGVAKNELLSTGNRAVDAVADMANPTIDNASILLTALTRAIDGRSPSEILDGGEAVRDVARAAKLYGDEKAQTPVGAITGELAYNAPSLFIPGGTLRSRAMSLFGSGVASGLTKQVTDNPIVETAANVVGGLAPGAVASTVRSMATNVAESAPALKERALGIMYNDKKRGLGRAPMFLAEDGSVVPKSSISDAVSVEAPIQQQIKMIEDAGILENAPSQPDKLKVHLAQNEEKVGTEIQNLIGKADSVVGNEEFLPEFPATEKYLQTLTKSDRERLAKRFEQELSDYIEEEGSGLSKVVRFKGKIGKKTNFDALTPKDQTQLYRAIYRDFQVAGESIFNEAVPELAGEFRSKNLLESALKTFGQTMNSATAKKAQTISGALQGGSRPVATAALIGSMLAGAPTGTALAGVAALGKAALNTAESNRPLAMAKIYEAIGDAGERTLPSWGDTGAILPSLGARSSIGTGTTDQLPRDDSSALDFPPEDPELQQPYDEVAPRQGKEATGSRSSSTTTAQKALPNDPRSSREREISLQEQRNPEDRPTSNPPSSNSSTFDTAWDELSGRKVSAGSAALPAQIIDSAFAQLGSDPMPNRVTTALKQAVIKQESNGNPKAVGPKTKYGTAKGLMQLIDSTGREWHDKLGIKEPYDPFNGEQNAQIGTAYLDWLVDQFDGDIPLALAAYNGGIGNVQKALRKSQTKTFEGIVPELRKMGLKETIAYVPSVLGKMEDA